MKLQQQNTIDDALACAKFLVARGYTAAAHLAIEGTSAGGLAAGGELTQRPERFGAAILRVPLVGPIGYDGGSIVDGEQRSSRADVAGGEDDGAPASGVRQPPTDPAPRRGDAGHGLVGATRAQVDGELADIYAFLWWQLARPSSAKTRQAR